MEENKRNRVKWFVTKILGIAFLMVLAVFLFYEAPYFKPTETFKKGALRLVVDDKDVTNQLVDPVCLENGVVMMSASTAMRYFDNIFIFYDEKYDTVIVTSEDMIGKIKLGENAITVNGEVQELKGTAKMSGDILYVPISSLANVTKVDVYFKEKVVATTPRGRSRAKVAQVFSTHHLKAYQREIALTTGKASKNELIYVFDTEGKSGDDYLTIRDERGNIGYYRYDKINGMPVQYNQGEEALQYQLKKYGLKTDIKHSFAWEYASHVTPDRMGQTKIDGLEIILPTWVEVKNEAGELTTTIDRKYLKWAKAQGYRVWPTIKNDKLLGPDGTDMSKLSTIMNDMQLREQLIQNILNLVREYEFEGINLDFEYMYKADKDVFSEFVRELCATLRRNQIFSSVDVIVPDGSDNYSLCFDRKAIGKVADYVMLMAYDQYGTWSPKAGPTASLSWVEANIQKMLNTEQVPKEKLVLCVPFYSRFWRVKTESGDKISSSAIYMQRANEYLQQYRENSKWSDEDGQYYIEVEQNNGTTMKIWVENEASLAKKIELVNEYDLAGVAAWRWGFEDGNGVWETIRETMNQK